MTKSPNPLEVNDLQISLPAIDQTPLQDKPTHDEGILSVEKTTEFIYLIAY